MRVISRCFGYGAKLRDFLVRLRDEERWSGLVRERRNRVDLK